MRWCFPLFLLTLVLLCDGAGVREGMTQLQVEAALGKPVAALRRGERMVLTYPKGGRVVLERDRVVEMVNVEVGEGSRAAQPAQVPAPPVEDDLDPAEAASTLGKPAGNAAVPTIDPIANVDKMLEGLSQPKEDPPPSGSRFWLALLAASLLRIVFVMIVLKFAFRWADVHADWGQMFLPALAETMVLVGFAVAGQMLLHVQNWFYVDEGISYLALLFVLLKATHACTLSRAVAVAGAAKIMSIVVGAAISVLLLRLFM